jgi:Zn-dependent metalloprotease
VRVIEEDNMHTTKKSSQVLIAVVLIVTVVLSGFFPLAASAQDADGIKRQVNAESGRISFVGPESGRVLSASRALGTFARPQDPAMALAKRFGPEFGLKSPERELSEMRTSRPGDGRVTTHYQQTYQGIPVMGGELIVNTNENGDLYSMNGEVSPALSLSTQPEITPVQARETALAAVTKWYGHTPAGFITSEPELWIYDESLLRPSIRSAELVWRMDVTSSDNGQPLRELVLVNAKRGGISLHFNQVDTTWSGSVDKTTDHQTSKTWYVATTGNDTNDCQTTTAPCASINGAIAKAASGDAIKVTTGTYVGISSSVVDIFNKNINLSGGWNSTFDMQTGATTLDGQNSRQVLRVGNGTVVIERFTIINGSYFPTFDSGGGGIEVSAFGNLTLNNSSVYSNKARNGGGIYLGEYTTLTLNNSTISGNQASYYGGGIATPSSGFGPFPIINISYTTITNNTAWDGGGITGLGKRTINNSILAGNTTTNSHPDCGTGTLVSSTGYNIFGGSSTCESIALQAGDVIGVDPRLDTLSASGYHALLLDSPAIDAANPNTCPSTDQRGIARPVGAGCDIGSYEVDYFPPPSPYRVIVKSGSPQSAEILTSFSEPLSVVVLDQYGNPFSGVSVTFTAPTNGPTGTFPGGPNQTTVISNANGTATTLTFTANGVGGSYTVEAIAPSVSYSAEFQLTNNQNWYVTTTGNDSNNCNILATPCASINGVQAKVGFVAGDIIKLAKGTYTGSGSGPIAIFSKDLKLSGGWNNTFTSQDGMTILDGQSTRRNILVNNGVTARIENINLTNGYTSQGAGIYNQGNLTITGTVIYNNRVYEDGAGIYQRSGKLTVENSTISNNTAKSSGGGIYVYDGVVAINHATITQNVAVDPTSLSIGGGLSNYFNKPVTISNTIVAGNIAESVPDCRGIITSGGYNLIGYNDLLGYREGCYINPVEGDQVGSINTPLNALLGNLKNNSGGTLTHALLPGSPAIDAGGMERCASKDQRGMVRPQGSSCDIGAFEGFESQSAIAPVRTYTAINRTDNIPGTFLCDETTPACTNGSDLHADSAHLYALGTSQLYLDKNNRNSIDNNNMPIISSVHYALNFGNAFWNGAQMVYGDAQGWPLADDIVAHELTHGVTQYESNLYYYYQSGAINESFSDLWGEYYDQTNGLGNDAAGVKWLIGEDIAGWTNPAPLPAIGLRSMSNPTLYKDPDKMSSTNYYEGEADNGGVHWNSGVNNKAVYLMVDGGTFNGKTVTALGWEKTGAIYYEANANLLVSGADFSDLYYALQQACVNLIGQKSITPGDCAEVKDALNAVEMNGQPASNFNTNAPLCASGLFPNVTFADDLETGTAKWIFTNGAYTRWQYDSPYGQYAQSGRHFLYADDYPGVVTDAKAQLAAFQVPANSYLHFAHAYDFEADSSYWDGGVLEYSTNGGGTWVDAGSLIQYNGYKGKIFTGAGNPLSGRSAFVGVSHGYISTRVNLASLAGKTVTFRWRMGLDEAVSAWGWWLDNIKVYTCVPGVTISGNAGATAGATLSYVDSTFKTVTSDEADNYSIMVPFGWSGTITPSHTCYTFSPTSRAYSNVTTNQAGQNYTSAIASGCTGVDVYIGDPVIPVRAYALTGGAG